MRSSTAEIALPRDHMGDLASNIAVRLLLGKASGNFHRLDDEPDISNTWRECLHVIALLPVVPSRAGLHDAHFMLGP